MQYFNIENLNVTDFTLSNEIYSLQIRTENKTKWIVINYSNQFKYSDWTIEQAINYYLSKEGKMAHFDSWYKTWCD